MEIPEQYVWLVWANTFLLPWTIIFLIFRRFRERMLRASLYTMPFGLTEPLFVPEYWNPPTLVNLAQNTGFDIESLVFCFGIGGISVVLYNLVTRIPEKNILVSERHAKRHKYHRIALFSPFLIFLALIFFNWNAIYPGIIAMLGGSLATAFCRPDLIKKTWVGGVIFVVYYYFFLLGLEWLSPGYVDKYWNLQNLSQVTVLSFPIEEFLFALSFGMYWSSVYEHLYWKKMASK